MNIDGREMLYHALAYLAVQPTNNTKEYRNWKASKTLLNRLINSFVRPEPVLPITIHVKYMTGHTASIKHRQAIELAIVAAFVNQVIRAGYSISVYDGEETTVTKCRNVDLVIKAMMTSNNDFLTVYAPNHEKQGWAEFIYGNDGFDVISDYGTGIEFLMTDANRIAERAETGNYSIAF